MSDKYLAENSILCKRYLIVRLLDKGGMGIVYEAIDTRLGCRVALKKAKYTDDQSHKHFEREAHLLASLRHPGLPRVIDYFSDASGQFFVMDLIDGQDLKSLLDERKQPFPHKEVLAWGNQVLDVLHYLHSKQPPVFHRDIKPQNLKLKKDGKIILLDFGLAKGAAPYMTHMSAGNSLFGFTREYAPLEQLVRADYFLHQASPILNTTQLEEIMNEYTDARTDLYSLAATMYHLITGVIPTNPVDRFLTLWRGDPDPLQGVDLICHDVPLQVAVFLRQAMAIRREWRFVSATAMQRALQVVMQPASTAYDTKSELPTLPMVEYQADQGAQVLDDTESLEPTRVIYGDEIEKTHSEGINPNPDSESANGLREMKAPAQTSPKIWKLTPVAPAKKNKDAPSKIWKLTPVAPAKKDAAESADTDKPGI